MKNVYSMVLKFSVLPVVLLVICDYFNIPSALGMNMVNINYDLLGAILNAAVVIALFVITYMVIDKHQMEKDHNAKMTSYILRLSTYRKCKDLLKIVDNQEVITKYIVPKVDFSKSDVDNQIVINLQDGPFSEHPSILDFSKNGIVSHDELNTYLKIMEMYKSYISMRITFFDICNATELEHVALKQTLYSKKVELYKVLDQEIKKLQKSLNITD